MAALYLECYSGISGDMTVAALLDLGADQRVLKDALDSLGVGGYEIRTGRTVKCGIDAATFDVILNEEHEHSHEHGEHAHEHEGHNHDHGEHTHEHEGHSHDHQAHAHSHAHSHHSGHTHEHEEHGRKHGEHTHEHASHSHEHRALPQIIEIIDRAKITEKAKATAKKIFAIVAQAEAKIHGKPVDEVHFHEVGAIDSIVDIVGAAVCLDNLGIDEVYTSVLHEGRGYVKCQHGLMPVPAPATAQIFASHGIPVKITQNQGEMVTPTGAAIVAAVTTKFCPEEPFVFEKIGFGAGKKDFLCANVLRACIIKPAANKESVLKIECNIDDMPPEALGYAMERLFEAGARDVFFTPVYMKKNRPATMLTVICDEIKREPIIHNIFKHTATIGLRIQSAERAVMRRKAGRVITKYGEVDIKICEYGDLKRVYVEYESAKGLAQKHNAALCDVYKEAEKSIAEL